MRFVFLVPDLDFSPVCKVFHQMLYSLRLRALQGWAKLRLIRSDVEHGKTAMTAETPQEAAQCLLELENMQLHDQISHNAHKYTSQYFPPNEPTVFWQRELVAS